MLIVDTNVLYAATDHRSHTEQNAAIGGTYIRWHNNRAKPKCNFAEGSRIQQPDYKLNVA